MATNDVPGANPVNADKLSRGCWAEHDDGSLIFVKDIDENDRVIFEMYDVGTGGDPVYYPHAMTKLDFENQFSSFGAKKDKTKKDTIKWTWHDKTPFPWEKVMKIVKSPLPGMSATDTISAAKRIAESLKARSSFLDEDHVDQVRDDASKGKTRFARAAEAFMKGLSEAMQELGE